MNHETLHKLIDAEQKNICQIAIMHYGELIYSDTWNGYRKDDLVHIASATKSITAILVGIAIDKGIIKSVDQNVLDFFPEYQLKRGEKTLEQVKIKHLLSMTTPYKFKSEPWTKVCMSDDWAKAALDLMGGKSGLTNTFQYTSLGIQVISEIIARESNMSMLQFANQYLFKPLQIDERIGYNVQNKEEHIAFVTRKKPQNKCWFTDVKGNATAGFGLCLSAEEMVKIGQLCLNFGEYHGMRIVSKEWIEQMMMVHALPGQRYHNMKYGYFWWIINEDEKIYSAIGDSGNVIYLDMKNNLVVTVASSFKPAVFDRVEFIQNEIIPLVF